MKTIKTQNIDGYDVIIGTHDAGGFVDAEATRKIVEKEILKTPEWKNLNEKKGHMQVYANQAAQAARNAARAKTPGDKNNAVNEYQERWKQIREIQEDMKPLASALQSKYGELMTAHAQYFSLKPDEFYADETEAAEIENLMVEATAAGEVVTKDKTRVKNYVGRVYWKKSGSTWTKAEITRLGDVPASGAIEARDLTENQQAEISDQLEKERIAGLSAQKKAAEKEAVIAGLVARAGLMKSELEVKGDNKALKTSQDWLAAETAKVEIKYA